MPRPCSVCNHEQRAKIDAALVNGTALRDIAGQHGVSRSALSRHKDEHVPLSLVQAADAQDAADADDLLAQLRSLQARTLGILDKAECADDLRTAVAAIGQARGNLELLGKLAGQLQQEGTLNITISPQWIVIRTALLGALSDHPEARQAVVAALEVVDAAD